MGNAEKFRAGQAFLCLIEPQAQRIFSIGRLCQHLLPGSINPPDVFRLQEPEFLLPDPRKAGRMLG